jgi:ribosomal protein S25
MSLEIINFMQNAGSVLSNANNNNEFINQLVSIAAKSVGANVMITTNSGGHVIAKSNDCPVEPFVIQDGKVVFGDDSYQNKVASLVVKIPTTSSDASVVFFKDGATEEYSDNDELICNLIAHDAALTMQQQMQEKLNSELREEKAARAVLESLSYTEIDVIAQVFQHIHDGEGLVVASRIADTNGYARSVTVNALRKLESAGVVQTRSLGVKGTFIRVLNSKLCSEISKCKVQKPV